MKLKEAYAKKGIIRLTGLALRRGVFIEGDKSVNLPTDSIDWGYRCSGAKLLALRILNTVLEEPVLTTDKYVEALYETILILLPDGNFDILFDIQEWIDINLGKSISNKYVTSYAFYSVNIGEIENPLFVSAYLDFATRGSVGVFNTDSIEYNMYTELQEDARSLLSRYCAKCTTRKDIKKYQTEAGDTFTSMELAHTTYNEQLTVSKGLINNEIKSYKRSEYYGGRNHRNTYYS